ncbi:hypothetical protein VULLAG_LOCUS15781 [Vulpes lagopus]
MATVDRTKRFLDCCRHLVVSLFRASLHRCPDLHTRRSASHICRDSAVPTKEVAVAHLQRGRCGQAPAAVPPSSHTGSNIYTSQENGAAALGAAEAEQEHPGRVGDRGVSPAQAQAQAQARSAMPE